MGDDAFPLKENLMKPYPFRALSYEKRTFNYRLSRARRIVENAFGIRPNCFRVFLSPIQFEPKIVEKITVASCVLHNYLREKIPLKYSTPGNFDCENIENVEWGMAQQHRESTINSCKRQQQLHNRCHEDRR